MTLGSLSLFVSLSLNEKSSDIFGLVSIQEGVLLDMLRSSESSETGKAAYVNISASIKRDCHGDVIIVGELVPPRKGTDNGKLGGVSETGHGKFMLFGSEAVYGGYNVRGFLCLTESEIVKALKSVKDVYQEGRACNIPLSGRVRTDKNGVNYVSGKIGSLDTERAEFLKLSLPGRRKNPFSLEASFQDVVDRRTVIKNGYRGGQTTVDVDTQPQPTYQQSQKNRFHFFD